MYEKREPILETESENLEFLLAVHQGSIIAFFGSLIYVIYTVFVQGDLLNFLTSVPFLLIFSLEIIFFRFKLIEPLKILMVMGLPLLISVETLFLGGDFSQSAGLLACLAVGFVFYAKHKKRLLTIGVMMVALHIGVLLYLRFEGPLFGLKDDPYDDIVFLVVSAGYLYFLFTKHDRDQNDLIQRLEEKNESLMATTQELERFTNIASHDLKSPLRNIASFLGLIERKFKQGDTTDLLDHLEYARKGAIQMNHLLEGILEISKVNQNDNPRLENIDLNCLLENAIDNLHQDILDKKAVVSNAPLPHYRCNPFEMTLLFQNLVQNAIKYNQSEQPKVDINCVEEAGFLKISIADNGIGIEEQYHQYIFEHFKRLHVSSEYTGTGLGLSLCRKIVQKHGGELSLQSTFGQGSIFEAVLPLNPTMQ